MAIIGIIIIKIMGFCMWNKWGRRNSWRPKHKHQRRLTLISLLLKWGENVHEQEYSTLLAFLKLSLLMWYPIVSAATRLLVKMHGKLLQATFWDLLRMNNYLFETCFKDNLMGIKYLKNCATCWSFSRMWFVVSISVSRSVIHWLGS